MLPRRVAELQERLKSSEPDELQAALRELAELRQPEALTLLRAEGSHSSEERAAFAREQFEAAVCSHSERALRHSDYEIREASLHILSERREERAIAEVSRILRNESSEALRELAAKTLARIGQPGCVEGLQRAQTDESRRIRTVALEALIQLRYATAERAIVEFLDDEDWSLRERAFQQLTNNGWQPKTNRERVLRAIMLGRFDEVIQFAADALQPLVNAALCPGNAEVRHWAAMSLARIRSPRVVEALRAGLRSQNPEVQQAAEAALQIVGTPAPAKSKPAPKPEATIAKPERDEPSRPFEEACEMLAAALEL